MKEHEIALVRESFERIRPMSRAAARLFYAKLFELDPSLKPMFRGDMTEQGDKLMQALGFVVGSLTKLDTLLPVVEEMGKRHARYGVKKPHYDTVGTALLDTLSVGLGHEFTPAVAHAWEKAYGILAGVMIQAAAAAEAEEVELTRLPLRVAVAGC